MGRASTAVFFLLISAGLGLTIGAPVALDWDPHFTGFDGAPYVFRGFAGGYFNIYSDPAHQVNMLYDDFGMSGLTFIKALGIKYGADDLQIAVHSKPFPGKDGQLHASVEVMVDGKSMVVDEKGEGAATVEDVQISSGRDIVTVTTPTLRIQCTKAQFDLSVTLEFIDPPNNAKDVHGSLGQTYRWDHTEGPHMLEGDESDYMVSDLFADDFTFNRFLGQDAA